MNTEAFPALLNSLAAAGSLIAADSQLASNTGNYPRRIDPSSEGNKEVLYSSAELWSILT